MTSEIEEPGVSRHISRVGKRMLSGHFDPVVIRALKTLAAANDTTLQMLLTRAINDLLEKEGLPRLASEDVLPRGGAAQAAYARAAKATPSSEGR